MTELGYTLSSEEHSPTNLVEYAQRAEDAGLYFLSISDHYHPWISVQGNAPFVWSTIGGIATATETIDAGYDHVYIHQIGDDQAVLLEMYREEVLPSFS